MSDLTEFSSLSLDELMREIERMKHSRIVKHYPSLLPPTASAAILLPTSNKADAVGNYSCSTNQTTRI